MKAEYEREIRRLYKSFNVGTTDASLAAQLKLLLSSLGAKWSGRFARASAKIVERMVGRVDTAATTSLNASLKELSGGLTIKTPKVPAPLRDKLIAATAENVALIKSIPAEYAQRIESTVMVSLQTGGTGAADVFEEIQHIGAVTEKRAELIARDQTSKITTAMNAERAQSAGVVEFEWLHSGGGVEPRELHESMSGKIFRYDDPPVIDLKTGERGLPGQLINCRCVARPILNFGD